MIDIEINGKLYSDAPCLEHIRSRCRVEDLHNKNYDLIISRSIREMAQRIRHYHEQPLNIDKVNEYLSFIRTTTFGEYFKDYSDGGLILYPDKEYPFFLGEKPYHRLIFKTDKHSYTFIVLITSIFRYAIENIETALDIMSWESDPYLTPDQKFFLGHYCNNTFSIRGTRFIGHKILNIYSGCYPEYFPLWLGKILETNNQIESSFVSALIPSNILTIFNIATLNYKSYEYTASNYKKIYTKFTGQKVE